MNPSFFTEAQTAPSPRPIRPVRLVFLTNQLTPYWKPVLHELNVRCSQFRVLVSTVREPNRNWDVSWEGIDVRLQRTLTVNTRWKHPRGFQEPLFLHIPIDTFAELRKFRPEVIISSEMGARSLLATIYRLFHSNVKLVIWSEVTEWTEQGRGILRRPVRRLLMGRCDAFITPGRASLKYLESRGVDPRRIFKVPYATDVDNFARVPLFRSAECAHRLLYVGQLIERKGLREFIAALCRWADRHREREVELCLVGEGCLGEELNRPSRPTNFHLTLLGKLAYEQLPAVYADFGILAAPTLADTWGLTVNEAMASGLPVLGSAYGQAVAELVEEGRTGWVFRPDRPAEMDGAIEQCLGASVETLNRMRPVVREAALRLSPQRIAELLERAVTICLNRN